MGQAEEPRLPPPPSPGNGKLWPVLCLWWVQQAVMPANKTNLKGHVPKTICVGPPHAAGGAVTTGDRVWGVMRRIVVGLGSLSFWRSCWGGGGGQPLPALTCHGMGHAQGLSGSTGCMRKPGGRGVGVQQKIAPRETHILCG